MKHRGASNPAPSQQAGRKDLPPSHPPTKAPLVPPSGGERRHGCERLKACVPANPHVETLPHAEVLGHRPWEKIRVRGGLEGGALIKGTGAHKGNS